MNKENKPKRRLKQRTIWTLKEIVDKIERHIELISLLIGLNTIFLFFILLRLYLW